MNPSQTANLGVGNNIMIFPNQNRLRRLDSGALVLQKLFDDKNAGASADDTTSTERPGRDTLSLSLETKRKLYTSLLDPAPPDPSLTADMLYAMNSCRNYLTNIAHFKDKIHSIQSSIKLLIQKAKFQLCRLSLAETSIEDIPEICSQILTLMSTEVKSKLVELASLIPKQRVALDGQNHKIPAVEYSTNFHAIIGHNLRKLISTTAIAYFLKEHSFPTMEVVASILGLNPVLTPAPALDDVNRMQSTYKPVESLEVAMGNLNNLGESASEIEDSKQAKDENNIKFLDLGLDDYLLGLLTMAFRLSDLVTVYATYGHYELLFFIDEFLGILNISMMQISLPNNKVRRVYDVLKYKVRSSNQVVARINACSLFV